MTISTKVRRTVINVLLLFVVSGALGWVCFRHGSSAGFGFGLLALAVFAATGYALLQMFWIGVLYLIDSFKPTRKHP